MPIREKPEKIVINAVYVTAMCPGILESGRRDLRERAAAPPPRRHKRIDGRCVTLPVAVGGLIAPWGERLSVIVQPLVVAVPLVGFHRECVARIRGSFVMPLDLARSIEPTKMMMH